MTSLLSPDISCLLPVFTAPNIVHFYCYSLFILCRSASRFDVSFSVQCATLNYKSMLAYLQYSLRIDYKNCSAGTITCTQYIVETGLLHSVSYSRLPSRLELAPNSYPDSRMEEEGRDWVGAYTFHITIPSSTWLRPS
jgi:hypothetical protein